MMSPFQVMSQFQVYDEKNLEHFYDSSIIKLAAISPIFLWVFWNFNEICMNYILLVY